MSLADILGEVRPTPAAYREAARRLGALDRSGLQPLRLALLGSFTLQPLVPFLAVEAARRGLLLETWVGAHELLEAAVLDPKGPLASFDPQAAILATRLEDLSSDLCWHFAGLGREGVEAEVGRATARLGRLLDGLAGRSVLVFNFIEPALPLAGLAGAAADPAPAAAIGALNEGLAAGCRARPGARVFDYARLALEVGLEQLLDPRLELLARQPWSVRGQIAVARRLARYLRAMFRPAAKCLVVDLDNTLWGGVIGEDGLGGIALGADHPGRVYQDFQRHLLALRERGTLLAIASKNNLADAREVFDRHPDMVLRLDDFACAEIHWGDKPASLQAIARTLDLGTDALAFFDDSPVEREAVRFALPEVAVIDVPEDRLAWGKALEESGAFDALTLTAEDRARARSYQVRLRLAADAARRGPGEGLAGFLESLGTCVTIGRIGRDTLARAAQLSQKTNQFNLTTRRRSEAELAARIDQGALAAGMRVKDRYGEYGMVGLAIAEPGSGRDWTIDTFLLSCRVIGRGVESAFLAWLARQVAAAGGERLIGEYLPTARNGIVARFYPDHGFEPGPGPGERWQLDLRRQKIEPPAGIALQED